MDHQLKSILTVEHILFVSTFGLKCTETSVDNMYTDKGLLRNLK